MMSEKMSYEIDPDMFRYNLLKYTRKAWSMIPKIVRPHILDIGCGSGLPTIELAKLSGGQIIGVDIDQEMLVKLEKESTRIGLADQIHTVMCSLNEMSFDEGSFDIIWAEGSIYGIGFKKGLEEFGKLLKSDGYIVIHDELSGYQEKLEFITKCGYRIIGDFILSKEIWRDEYYEPMKKRLEEIQGKEKVKSDDLQVIEQCKKELSDFEREPETFQSVFFVMQKTY
jgi:ubiquinone/menaquinone biosynthesis C-methylase UbiE